MRTIGRMSGKIEMMRHEIQRRLDRGERIAIVTPAGTIDGAQWLANRGLGEDPTEYPAHRIARGDQ